MSLPLEDEALEALRDPAISLRAYAKIIDQKTGQEHAYDPFAITKRLQETVVSYYSNPPQTDLGQTKWLTLLGYRQGGKSLTSELCGYVRSAYTPGHDHVCIADNRDRAEYLHRRIHLTHSKWPEPVRAKTVPNREVRQLTFQHGGKMRVLSGESGAVGIGQSPDSFHGSELPYWRNAGHQFSMIYPSMINRDHSLVLLESTPAPIIEPSTEWWRDQCRDAKLGLGRWVYAFFPFWDGQLNQRKWPDNLALENEEIRLLERYGHLGLKKENLAFRRLMLETDAEIRRNPDLFKVYYPYDDISCWISNIGSVFHSSLLKRHQEKMLVPWNAPYMEYEKPEAGAVYVMGVDPAGYAARDHASFQVLKVYDGEWTQVATFGGITDPVLFAKKISDVGRRYNNALVAVESNGVGVATLALLEDAGYPNLYYEKAYRPGVAATAKSVSMMLSYLQDALKDELILYDEDTVGQLGSYREDKQVERSATAEMLHSGKPGRRRDRHHWDKISALQLACLAARRAPRRYKKNTAPEGLGNVLLFRDMTYNQVEAHRKNTTKTLNQRRWRRSKYRRR
ncbi:MAG: putative terminase large subunit [Prokaryotic dsDNA virus sp.]|nr:MAG: putative terminase large subunit [Prokaryotic dsDNA virus sp.]|tara:strand:- start:2950 stop:4650 length:1701 start_codon:yes stop_codon:yes gene_type:complete